jgi:hypothetical protein
MNLSPRFYLGPIDVASDGNSELTAVWHCQLLHRQFHLTNSTQPSAAMRLPALEEATDSVLPLDLFSLHVHEAFNAGQRTSNIGLPFADIQASWSLTHSLGDLVQQHHVISIAESLGLTGNASRLD